MKRFLIAIALALASVAGVAQTSFYTDQAVGVFPLPGGGGRAGLIPIQYGQVRVCGSPAIGSPCVNTATITDLSGNPLPIVGGNFGQLTTDVTGRFSFGCTVGNYVIQVAGSSSNVPQLNYPITCPLGSISGLGFDAIYARLDATNQPFTGTVKAPTFNLNTSTGCLTWATVADVFLCRASGQLTLGTTSGGTDALLKLGTLSLAGITSGTGTLSVDATATKITASLPLNATTGFQIGGAAAANQVLGGNGTNFISRVITPSDATGNTSGSGNFALVTSPAFTTPNIGVATATAVLSATANPAAAGVLRLASGDLINFRNNANSADLSIAKTGATTGLVIADTLNVSSFSGLFLAGPIWGANSIAVDVTHPISIPAVTDTMALIGATQTFTNKRISPRVVTVTNATTLTPDGDNSDVSFQNNTQAGGTLTVAAPTGTPTDGQKLIIRVKSTNAQTYSFNATFRFSTTTVAPTTLGAGKTDYLGAMWNATDSKWDVVAVDQGH